MKRLVSGKPFFLGLLSGVLSFMEAGLNIMMELMEAMPFSGDWFTEKDNQFIRFTPFDVQITGQFTKG